MNEEGRLEQDLSKDVDVPGLMCWGSFAVREGKIYGVGNSRLGGKWQWEWEMKVFNGKKWKML